MAKKNKRLNILNTQKVFNLTLEKREHPEIISGPVMEHVKSRLKEKKDDLFSLTKIEGNYVYRLGEHESDYNFVKELASSLEKMKIEIKKPLPIPLLDYLVRFPRNVSIVIPLLKAEDFSPELIENIQFISAGLKVTIIVNVDNFKEDAFSVLSALGDLPYVIDEVDIIYNNTSIVDVYNFFTELRDALSGWKMNIVIQTNSEEETEYLINRKSEDEKEKKSSTVWRKL